MSSRPRISAISPVPLRYLPLHLIHHPPLLLYLPLQRRLIYLLPLPSALSPSYSFSSPSLTSPLSSSLFTLSFTFPSLPPSSLPSPSPSSSPLILSLSYILSLFSLPSLLLPSIPFSPLTIYLPSSFTSPLIPFIITLLPFYPITPLTSSSPYNPTYPNSPPYLFSPSSSSRCPSSLHHHLLHHTVTVLRISLLLLLPLLYYPLHHLYLLFLLFQLSVLSSYHLSHLLSFPFQLRVLLPQLLFLLARSSILTYCCSITSISLSIISSSYSPRLTSSFHHPLLPKPLPPHSLTTANTVFTFKSCTPPLFRASPRKLRTHRHRMLRLTPTERDLMAGYSRRVASARTAESVLGIRWR